MCATQDSNDPAFGALSAGDSPQPLDLCKNVIAVHGVLDGVARDEDVAIELGDWRIRDNKAVAVVVKNEATFYFITTRDRRGLRTAPCVLVRVLPRASTLGPSAGKAVASPG